MKKVGKIIAWVIIGILSVLAILIGILFVQTLTNPHEIPNLFGYKPFIVLSGSMETMISEGDLVIVKEVDPSELKENDIIAFRVTTNDDEYVVTHRIKEINEVDGETRITTQGDANNAQDDGYVTFNQIEGIYVTKYEGLGNVVMTLQKPTTLLIILVIIVATGIVFIFSDKSKMSEADKKELEELRKKNSK